MRKILLALSVLILAACGGHPSQGMVYDKTYKEPSSWIQMICSGYNSKGICIAYVPITHHTPECWSLELKGEGEKWNVCVPHDVWERTQIESTWKEPV